MIDYIAIMQKYHGSRNDGFLTDQPKGIKLADDDYVKVRYDAKAMRWIPSRPSRIKYPTARELIKQYRKEYAEKFG
jgi:hypothetical protein